MEILFKLIDNPVAHYVTEIVSHARNYLSNITNLWEAIIKQILMWSLPDTQRSGLSVHFVNVSLDEFIRIVKFNKTMKDRGTGKEEECFYNKKWGKITFKCETPHKCPKLLVQKN
ncbi:unnamed protein product [Lepeophtheirus salmonis]|uniref:(salmon louse) hypothetical protein n=1 Tax=Lepeophtheirus salmonis TaxID=72036 RepID=A0A7R8CM65_LEPSM|nr:unnamed protein product [Lepeophtheirus salmonis]CAF2864173.1 unnamed protein product [Lepeophtheirus salmonis]